MRKSHSAVLIVAVAATLFAVSPVGATGLATCDSGPRESWQPQAKRESTLKTQGWQVRRVKIDGG